MDGILIEEKVQPRHLPNLATYGACQRNVEQNEDEPTTAK